MGKRSFIYRHIVIYRLLMNLLYSGKYKRRFAPVTEHLTGMPAGFRVLELCFGDIFIADFCRKAGYQWKGLEVNEHFVSEAQKRGFDACYADLSAMDELPQADACIMMGSLYHFYPNVEAMLAKMLNAGKIVIISEPVLNLSSKSGLIGFLAKRSASIGKREESFRFNEKTFIELLDQSQSKLNFKTLSVQNHGKDIIVKLIKNGNHQP